VKGGQTAGGEPMLEEARRLYTEEIKAAVRGAKAAAVLVVCLRF
jgi:D-aminopeptidase